MYAHAFRLVYSWPGTDPDFCKGIKMNSKLRFSLKAYSEIRNVSPVLDTKNAPVQYSYMLKH